MTSKHEIDLIESCKIQNYGREYMSILILNENDFVEREKCSPAHTRDSHDGFSRILSASFLLLSCTGLSDIKLFFVFYDLYRNI